MEPPTGCPAKEKPPCWVPTWSWTSASCWRDSLRAGAPRSSDRCSVARRPLTCRDSPAPRWALLTHSDLQVEFVVLRHVTELRSIYSFYSSLGHASGSPDHDHAFPLSRLQYCRLLRDCRLHRRPGCRLARPDCPVPGEPPLTPTWRWSLKPCRSSQFRQI